MENNKLRNDLLVWVDLETTGLDQEDQMKGVHKHKILEVGMHITDSNFNVIDKGFEVVIHHKKSDLLPLMNEYVTNMHTVNGLLDRVENSRYSLRMAEKMMMEYLKAHNVKPESSPLCGNNISFDKNFLKAQMPDFTSLLHYRIIDISTLKEIFWRQSPEIAAELVKGNKHRGLEDIQDSIRELKFYQEKFFIPTNQLVAKKTTENTEELEVQRKNKIKP